jgi:hypothetical protein
MQIIKTALVAAVLAATGLAAQVQAAPQRLTDVQYIAANRCLGLMESKALGPTDNYAMKQLIKVQGTGREAAVWDMADQAHDNALSSANRADNYSKTRLTAERDGACEALLPPTQTTAAPSTSHND